MWYRVWGTASFLALLSVACGKSERGSADESGGTQGNLTGGTGMVGGGGAGASLSLGGSSNAMGGSNAAGGTSAVVGGSNAMGGMNVTLGGQPTEPAEGGAPTAGGAPACNEHYHACGCGCCGTHAGRATCVYPELGQGLANIIEQDLARRHDTVGCSAVGCTLGVDYFCCAAPPALNDGAMYQTSVVIGGYNRIRLFKMTAACSTLVLQQAPPTDPPDPQAFPVEVPAGWKFESVTSLPCISSAIGPPAIGAIGKFSLRALENSCVVDAHLTAFFSNDELELSAVRFDADGVPLDIPIGDCK